jgi:hypothetical protein
MRSTTGRRQVHERSISGPRGAVSLSRGLARGRATKSWPAGERYRRYRRGRQSPAGHVRRPSLPAEPPAAGFTCLPPGALLLPRRRALRHPVRRRLHGGEMKLPGAALSRSLRPPRLVPRPENRKPAARFPGGPGQGQPARRTSPPGVPPAMGPQRTPPGSAVRYPARRQRGGQHTARRGHRGGTGTTGGDEQARFPALPRDRHPSSGHPRPDMPHHHRLPARESQRCPDWALPPGPPRNTRPPLLPVASHTQNAHRPQRPLPGRGQPARQDHPTDPSSHPPQPTHGKGTRDIRPGPARHLPAATNRAVHTRPTCCTRSPPGPAGKHPDLPNRGHPRMRNERGSRARMSLFLRCDGRRVCRSSGSCPGTVPG